ncbi:unnamed protein product [Dibothriocephalus latus]|uniref:Fibronectin type-III domain-containing protein n=1 Tax=Dibothriocephalus latus TaxID=60516 RepID=A0A3P7MCY6_DIBLA|nr:unnamed protein product [Dibothriocephalus latus]
MLVKSYESGKLLNSSKAPASSGSHAVTGIKPNTVMSFTVQLIKPGALGGVSEIMHPPEIITWREQPPAPQTLEVTAKRINSISASWTDASDKAIHSKYQVRVTANDTRKMQILETSNTEIEVDNLETFMDYAVEVAKFSNPNQNGEGAVPGEPIGKTFKTWPGPGGTPANLNGDATDTNIAVSWKEPQVRPTGDLLYYEVTVREVDGIEVYKGQHVEGLEWTAQNLKPLKMHEIEVRRRNKPADRGELSGGLGEPARTEVETWPGGTLEPTKGTVEVVPPTSVKVTWSAPQGLFGTVETYFVVTKEEDRLVRNDSVPPTQTSILLTEIPADAKYQFYVQAKIAANSQGKGGRLSQEVFIGGTTSSCKSSNGNFNLLC